MKLLNRNFPSLTTLNEFFDDDWFRTRNSVENWLPAVNVVENEKNFEIEIAAPGFKKEDFTVTVENHVLHITGEFHSEKEESDKNYTRREFKANTFARAFTLPEHIQEDDINARYEDGLLKLVIAKSEKMLPTKKEVAIH